MREIKFRGKRVDNREWVEGLFTMTKWQSVNSVDNKGTWHEPKWEVRPEYQHLLDCQKINRGGYWFAAIQQADNFNSIVEVDPATVGQFTGLRDIYTGDICRITMACGEELIGEVVWDERHLCYALDIGSELWDFGNIIECEHGIEVIGNRFDNPELLEQKP